MKKENKEAIEKIIDNIRTAYYSDYTRAVPQSLLEAAERAYQDEHNNFTEYVFSGYTCNVCVLRGLKKIGEWYFNLPKEKDIKITSIKPKKVKEDGKEKEEGKE